jgi:cytochrome b6-f complex iron-sulfur subunit
MMYPWRWTFTFFVCVCASSGGGGAGVVAKDALGNDITVDGWLKAHPSGDRTLAQGLKV